MIRTDDSINLNKLLYADDSINLNKLLYADDSNYFIQMFPLI